MKLVFAVAVASVSLVAGLVLTPVAHLRAQWFPVLPAAPPYTTFGMVGVTAGQAVRLNALLLPMGGPIVAGASCQVTFAFLNDQGATLASATMPVNPNQAVHFDFPPLPTAATTRTEIRGTVQANFVDMSASPVAAFGNCSVVPTMEIFNPINGQTLLLLESAHSLPTVLPLATVQ